MVVSLTSLTARLQFMREGGRGLKHFPPNLLFPDLTPESYFCTGLVWAVRGGAQLRYVHIAREYYIVYIYQNIHNSQSQLTAVELQLQS